MQSTIEDRIVSNALEKIVVKRIVNFAEFLN